ncbi:MAG: sodium:proton antiporter [Candidatus Hatepunaea meridiana]|nr:sodium:proton antiporter [Candidatus Hatepunaea meridiana]
MRHIRYINRFKTCSAITGVGLAILFCLFSLTGTALVLAETTDNAELSLLPNKVDTTVNAEVVATAHISDTSQNEINELDHTDHSSSDDHHTEDKYGFHAAAEKMARELPLWAGLPFAGILLSIAFFPLILPHFWHKHFPKVSFAWSLVFAIPFIFVYKGLAIYEILHIYLIDYIPFIILLWGLYTVSGGILLRGSLVGTPKLNLKLLLIGTILASWMGTTGAAMLLIRPILRANAYRKNKVHIIIFFIFLVANVGGSLTPLGDPPLFLGFLHGVPFFWTFNIFPHFALTAVILLVIFYILDSIIYKREGVKPPEKNEKDAGKYPLRLEGVHNFLFLGGILAFVLMSGTWKPGHINVYGVHLELQNVARDLGIIMMGILSLKTTHIAIRKDNDFSWFPIMEVAYLFAGIFMCIIPMLAMLHAGSAGSMAFIVEMVKKPIHYFWITGALSSFLDNAPTYLTFFNLALGRLGLSEPQVTQILTGMSHVVGPEFVTYLKGISTGAVFFGAMTYIGNAPNFMVRSIAEEQGIKMPSFFGYMLWSGVFLLPVFVIVTLVFFI